MLALTLNVSHSQGRAEIQIEFVINLITKLESLVMRRHTREFWELPALGPSVDSELPGRKLCPVRALGFYFFRTKQSVLSILILCRFC